MHTYTIQTTYRLFKPWNRELLEVCIELSCPRKYGSNSITQYLYEDKILFALHQRKTDSETKFVVVILTTNLTTFFLI